jgi:S1-C subfamily serine protease
MVTLPPGANSAISSAGVTFILASQDQSAWDRAGVALIPVDEKRQPTGGAALLASPESWNSWFESEQNVGCKLSLDQLPTNTTRVLVVVYTYGAAIPMEFLRTLDLTIDSSITMNLPLQGLGDAALIIAEFYRRDSQWKVRALSEGSAYGLSAFGRRIGLNVDDSHPSRPSGSGRNDNDRCTSATGTGFAVSPNHIMTCAHVIRDMSSYRIRSLAGCYDLEFVMVDETNDLALLRVNGGVSLEPVVFKDGPSISLGEAVVAVGYPLSNLTGGSVAVTQGGISALTGLRADSSVLQFTAPIQPGSSGSPLFDMSGQVTGMVTSAISDAQNMNFAVKSCLAMSFLEAAQLQPRRSQSRSSMAAHELVREVQSSLWLIEARA